VALGFVTGAISAVGTAAKNLFSGAAKEARQARKEAKQEAKAAAKQAKEAAKAAITGGAKVGAKAGDIFAKIKTWIVQNWQILAVVALAVVAIFMMFRTKKRPVTRRRRSTGKGSAAMKARMAKVRAARRRKK